MKLFTWNMVIYYIIQIAWKGIQEIFQEIWLKMETEVRRRVWFFDENPTANRALYKMVSLKFSFYTILSHTVCVMPFLVIFYSGNVAMKLQDFATSLLSGILHGKWGAWLCLFFSKKNAIWNSESIQEEAWNSLEIWWWCMVMLIFSKRNAIFSVEFRDYARESMK